MTVGDIKTRLDTHKYYYEEMKYNRADKEEEKQLLKRHKKQDLKKMYILLFNQEPSSSYTKKVFLEKMQIYFDSIERSEKIWKY